MSRRFYAPQNWDQSPLRLEDDEAHHLRHVLRLGVGDEVIVFDGRGIEATARIVTVTKSAAELMLLERRPGPAESPVALTLATAVPKGDRFSWLVEKATELGITRLIPLSTDRTVVEAGAGKLERLRKTIIAASKQCGRARLMELTELMAWSDFVEQEIPHGDTYIADPSGDHCDFAALTVSRPVLLVVGPEGGFTEFELESACDAGASLISLGPRILRIETAAVALAAIFGAAISG